MLASSFIHPSLNPFDFLVKSFNEFLFMPFFRLASIKIVTRCCLRTCGWCVIITRTLMDGVQLLVHSAPPPFPNLPRRNVQVHGKSQLRSKRSLNEPSPEKFLSIGGFFECYTYWVMALGWLKKEEEERKKEGKKERTILAFDRFKFVTLLWARGNEPICRDGPISRWQLQSIY